MIRLRCGCRAVILSISTTVGYSQCPQILSYLHTAECKCKCKTFLLPNYHLFTDDLDYLNSTPFQAKIVSPSATMLGLFLHSPLQSVVSRFSQSGELLSPLSSFSYKLIEQSQLQKTIAKLTHRIKAGGHLGLSFRERTLFLSFYVLSLPQYHHSVLSFQTVHYHIL